MADNKGMAPTFATSNMVGRLMDNPIYQQKYAELANQGMDKRAVSNINRVLGQDIAQESRRMMSMDAASRELSRRKDKLDYAAKALEHERGQFDIRSEQTERAREFEDTRFHSELDTMVEQEELKRDLGIEQGDLSREFSVYKSEGNRSLDDMSFQSQQAIEEARLGMEESVFGLEFGLGLLSTGTSLYGDYKNHKQDRLERQRESEIMRMRQREYERSMGLNYSNIDPGNPEE